MKIKKQKFETGCEIPFKIDYLFRRGDAKSCGLTLQCGAKLSYVPIPYEIRYCNASIVRYLKTGDGQKTIKEHSDYINYLKFKEESRTNG